MRKSCDILQYFKMVDAPGKYNNIFHNRNGKISNLHFIDFDIENS
jgi:hypothetical protein